MLLCTTPTLPQNPDDPSNSIRTTDNWRTFQGTVMDTDMPAMTTGTCVFGTVPQQVGGNLYCPINGTALQNVLTGAGGVNQVQPGDTIVLKAGTTYAPPLSGQMVCPPATTVATAFCLPFISAPNPANRWILIVSSDMAALPDEHNRINPTYDLHMPRLTQLTSPGSASPTLYRSGSAGDTGRWRLVGVEIYPSSNLPCTYGAGTGSAATVNNCFTVDIMEIHGSYMIFDRCWIHGFDAMDADINNVVPTGDTKPRAGYRQDATRALYIATQPTDSQGNQIPVGNIAVIDSY